MLLNQNISSSNFINWIKSMIGMIKLEFWLNVQQHLPLQLKLDDNSCDNVSFVPVVAIIIVLSGWICLSSWKRVFPYSE